MLGRLFNRRKSERTAAGPHICMVAMRTIDGLTGESIARAARELFPGAALTQTPSEAPVLGLECNGLPLMMLPMPFPIPGDDIEFAVPRSWMWPKAAEAMKAQKAHVLITCLGGESARAVAMAATRATAAVCRAGDAVGVYWGNGGHVHEPSKFIEIAQDTDPPVPLWVGMVVSGSTNAGPYSLSSCGMTGLDHMELEIIDSRMRPVELIGTAYDVCAYLIDNGPVLQHGHTFGQDAHTKWRVEHTKSAFRRGEKVIRLHVP